MVKKEANLTAIMLVQQLEPKFWHTWEDTTPILEAPYNFEVLFQF